MNKYPVSAPLRSAIEFLFDDPSIGLGFLGRGIDFVPPSNNEHDLAPNLSAEDRARQLREKLEGYVVQMAAEANELGEGEVPRLRAETTAILITLRELQNYFPEAFT